MELAWRFGMIVLTGVPAIVGGGFFWELFGKWTVVILWEIALLCIMSVVISKGDKKAEPSH